MANSWKWNLYEQGFVGSEFRLMPSMLPLIGGYLALPVGGDAFSNGFWGNPAVTPDGELFFDVIAELTWVEWHTAVQHDWGPLH